MQKVFFFDIDDTLLPVGERGISENNKYAIEQLQKKGYDVYLATGKSLSMASRVVDELNIDKTITSNGNVIKEQGEITFSYSLEEEDVYEVQKMVNEKENLILGGQGNYGAYLLTENEEIYNTLIKPVFEELGVVKFKQTTLVEEDLYQLWILGDIDNVVLDTNKYDTFKWNEHGIDVLYKGTSKARAINYLLDNKYKDVEIETYAFGDSLNDVAMFELVDNAVAVSNAKEELKEVADYICDNSNNEGVFNYLVEKKII